MKPYLNISEAANFVGLSIGTLRQYTWRGMIPQIKTGPRNVKYSRLALLQFLDNRKGANRAQSALPTRQSDG